jgi:hypothetical protein
VFLCVAEETLTLICLYQTYFRRREHVSTQHPRITIEKKTIDAMVHIYCRGHHDTKGDELCPECTEFLSYAFMRLDKCPFQEEKTTCGKCLVHCYQPQMREKAKKLCDMRVRECFYTILVWRYITCLMDARSRKHWKNSRRKKPKVQPKSVEEKTYDS